MNARFLLRAGLVAAFALLTQAACQSRSAAARPDAAGSEPAAETIMKDRVVITNVMSETQLLAILESIEKVDGVREVLRLDFDRKTNEALLEIVGERRRQTYWRAHLENLPKITRTTNDNLSEKYPSWFTPKPAN